MNRNSSQASNWWVDQLIIGPNFVLSMKKSVWSACFVQYGNKEQLSCISDHLMYVFFIYLYWNLQKFLKYIPFFISIFSYLYVRLTILVKSFFIVTFFLLRKFSNGVYREVLQSLWRRLLTTYFNDIPLLMHFAVCFIVVLYTPLLSPMFMWLFRLND